MLLLYLVYIITNVETVHHICRMEPTNRLFTGILHISLRMDIKQCKRECLAISTSQCSSVIYVISKNLCLLLSGEQIESDDFIGQDIMNFHKICRRRTKMQSILLKKSCFEEFHGRVLLGVVDEIYENVSKIQCRKACALSLVQSNVLCKAAIYYPKEQECIIASQNRLDLPELFIEDAVAVYLENRCADEQFLKRMQNKHATEEATFSYTSVNDLFFKNGEFLLNTTSSMFLLVENEKTIESNDTAFLNQMPKKPIKEITKQVEQQPLQNIEMSGYKVNFDTSSAYPLHAEYNNSTVNPEAVDNNELTSLFHPQRTYLTY
uniref:Apple domain-containing protein n=1 Tax=Elaeophora elaphi TaxID=1147741 RepID=A0A0R3RQF1_9BILA